MTSAGSRRLLSRCSASNRYELKSTAGNSVPSTDSFRMKKLFFQLAVLFCVAQAVAADGAPTRTVYDSTLRNGFSIHHIRYEMMGNKTRLYTSNDSFIDVPTSDIVETIQSEEALLVVPEVKPKPDLNEVVRAASNKHQIDADLITAV